MKCAVVIICSFSVRDVRFSIATWNQAGVRGSKNETSQTGWPATVPLPTHVGVPQPGPERHRLRDRRRLPRLDPPSAGRPVPALAADDDAAVAAAHLVGARSGAPTRQGS